MSVKTVVLAMTTGILVGAGSVYFYLNKKDSSQVIDENKPLYWVAPMDPNYRRDGPGLSPMGMELIPVYEESDLGPGVVSISPEIINNLGVRTASAEEIKLDHEILAYANIKYDEDKLVHIHPRLEGWIDKLFVKTQGTMVEKGQPLYSLYSPQLVNAQDELVLAINQKSDRLIKAAVERLRAFKVSEEYIEQLKKTKKTSQTVVFRSPQKGVIHHLEIREGYFVQPQKTMMAIADHDSVWLEAEINEADVSFVRLGQNIEFVLDYFPAKTFAGTISFIYPDLDTKTRSLRVRSLIDNKHRHLKPGMFGKVKINVNSDASSSIVVAKEAVIRTGQQDRVVMSLGDGKYKSVTVTVGRVSGKKIEILEGVKAGDELVTSAQFLLDSESSVDSDFKRMDELEQEKPSHVWIDLEILMAMPDMGMIRAKHGPVEEWDWPPMTMNFFLDEDIDAEKFKKGDTISSKVMQDEEGDYLVVEIKDSEAQ